MSRGRLGVAGLLAATLLAVAACGDSGESGAGGVGVVLDEEFGGHQLREVPAADAPAVALEVRADEHGGWNLHLTVERFAFTPERVGDPARAGQGHAHVYVDDVKYSRVYSEWFYLPAQAVESGEHEVLVTLNADDHTVWAVDGEPVAATATVASGGGDGHAHAHADGADDGAPAAPPASPAADAELFEFAIADGRADPPLERARVELGATVRIVVASDQPDEIHLHGYDLTAEVAPGTPGVIEFVADQSGLFELETHESGLVLLQLQVQ